MAIEKERKFILKDGRLPSGLDTPVYIQQGYLVRGKNNHLRVRLQNGYMGMVAYKHDINSTDRYEFEFGASKLDAQKLLELSYGTVDKLRYKTTFEGNKVDIDIYVSANGKVFKEGLAVVEIEFEKEFTTLPDYCGQEVTGVPSYSNTFLASIGSYNK